MQWIIEEFYQNDSLLPDWKGEVGTTIPQEPIEPVRASLVHLSRRNKGQNSVLSQKGAAQPAPIMTQLSESRLPPTQVTAHGKQAGPS